MRNVTRLAFSQTREVEEVKKDLGNIEKKRIMYDDTLFFVCEKIYKKQGEKMMFICQI